MKSFDEQIQKIKQRYESGEDNKNLIELKEKITNQPIVLFGAGVFGLIVVKNFNLHGINIECLCDNKKTGTDPITGIEIISTEILIRDYKNANIVISVATPSIHRSIYEQIISLGFSEEQIFKFDDIFKLLIKFGNLTTKINYNEFLIHLNGYKRAYDFFDDNNSKDIIIGTINSYLFGDNFSFDFPDNTYFPSEIKLQDDEVFVDAGLYIGDTVEEFVRRTNGKYNKIYGFDIDGENFKIAESNLQKYNNIEIIQKGLWSNTCSQNADLGMLAGSNINEEAKTEVNLIALDDFFKDPPPPTFIKMDIEGAEMQALIGAEKLLKNNSPKLAISVYHQPQDIYELTELIHKFNPEYHFKLRSHLPFTLKTILYAYV